MDIFGVTVIAFVTALGRGTVRDVILGHYPIGWTQHPGYIALVIGAGLVTVLSPPTCTGRSACSSRSMRWASSRSR